MTDSNNTDDESKLTELTRRKSIASAAGLTAAGAAGFIFASGSATADPSGTFPVPSDDPLLKIRADRVRLVPRTSDPSSPDDGTEWYNEDA